LNSFDLIFSFQIFPLYHKSQEEILLSFWKNSQEDVIINWKIGQSLFLAVRILLLEKNKNYQTAKNSFLSLRPTVLEPQKIKHLPINTFPPPLIGLPENSSKITLTENNS